MMEEKSAAKCTKRFLREGKEGRKEGRKKDRETERGGVENAVAAADGGGGCCDDGGKVQLLLDLKRRKMRRRTTGKEEEKEEGQGGSRIRVRLGLSRCQLILLSSFDARSQISGWELLHDPSNTACACQRTVARAAFKNVCREI